MKYTARDWTFNGSWPYEPNWFMTPEGKMHYVDEGPRDGQPIVMIHGNPTWGYLWRNFIPPLVAAGYRAVVPDHLGFGRSKKPSAPEVYSIARHAARLELLLEHLGLAQATLVCHDWGGPIGLYWATRHWQRVSSLVILNTFAHRVEGRVPLPRSIQLFRCPILGEVLVKGMHAFVRFFLFREGIVSHKKLGADAKSAYLAPHQTWESRAGILEFPRQIPVSRDDHLNDFIGKINLGLSNLKNRPALIIWAMRDVVLRPAVLERLWLRDLPNAQVVRLPNAGHFLQEDSPAEINEALLAFLEGLDAGQERETGEDIRT